MSESSKTPWVMVYLTGGRTVTILGAMEAKDQPSDYVLPAAVGFYADANRLLAAGQVGRVVSFFAWHQVIA